MLKLVKEKMLVSLIVVALLATVFCSLNSLATTIKPSSTANTNTTANADDKDENKEKNENKNTNKNTNKDKNENKNTNKNTNSNKSNYKNTNKNTASKLPYAGSNSSVIFVVIALGASAIYAYKKVSDYNV